MERPDLCWAVSVLPTRPELSIISIFVSDDYPVRKGVGTLTTVVIMGGETAYILDDFAARSCSKARVPSSNDFFE